MRKLTIVLFMGAGLLAGCKEKEQEKTTALFYFTPYSDFPEYLKGQLKTVKELNYWAIEKDGQVVPGDLITQKERDSLNWSSDFTASYNEAGVPSRVDYVTYDWKINSWVIDIEDNLITKATWVRLDTPRSYYKSVYDANRKHVESKGYRYGKDTLIQNVTLNYDQNGKNDAVKYFNYKGEPTGRNTYLWNEKSLVSEFNSYNSSDSLTATAIIEYNENGYYTKAEYRDGNGKILRTLKPEYIEYDDRGNWKNAVIYDNGKLTFYCKREYVYY
jgi:hypothetical protein